MNPEIRSGTKQMKLCILQIFPVRVSSTENTMKIALKTSDTNTQAKLFETPIDSDCINPSFFLHKLNLIEVNIYWPSIS